MPATKRQAPIEVALPPYGVFLLESHHAPGFRMVEQSHGFLELFFVLSGSGNFRIAGNSHACQRNDLVVVPPRQLHVIEDDPARPLSLYAVCVAESVVRHEPDLFERLPAGRVRVGKSLAGEIRASFRRLLFEQTCQRPFGSTLIVGLTLQLLASLAGYSGTDVQHRSTEPTDAPAAARRAAIERYVAGLSHRFFERTSLDEAAVELGMSRRRFTTLFLEVTDQTWVEYLTELRVNYSKTLLGKPRGASSASRSNAATKSFSASTARLRSAPACRPANGASAGGNPDCPICKSQLPALPRHFSAV